MNTKYSGPMEFRAYDKSGGGVFVDVYAIDFYRRRIKINDDIDDNNPDNWRCWDDSGEEITLTQFTGLYDKNDVPIYNGDIVEVKYSDGSGYDNPVEVSFENGSFWAGMGYLNDIKIIEVVGNIFQNPELLK